MATHWCHLCSEVVGVDDTNSCLMCGQGFVEEREVQQMFPVEINDSPPPGVIFEHMVQLPADPPESGTAIRVDPMQLAGLIQHILERHMLNVLQQSLNEHESIKVGASKEFIDQLVQHMLTDGQLTEKCPICIDDFKKELRGTPLPCGHIYHDDCIKSWLKVDHVCPVCRAKLPSAEPEDILQDIPSEDDS